LRANVEVKEKPKVGLGRFRNRPFVCFAEENLISSTYRKIALGPVLGCPLEYRVQPEIQARR
jgi:hypothetical protein